MVPARYTLDVKKRRELDVEATRIVHEDKPWLELSLKPRADDRLLAAGRSPARW